MSAQRFFPLYGCYLLGMVAGAATEAVRVPHWVGYVATGLATGLMVWQTFYARSSSSQPGEP